MIREIQWPRCARCHKAADVRPDEQGRLWAQCCGARVSIRIAFVAVDAKPLRVGEQRGRAS